MNWDKFDRWLIIVVGGFSLGCAVSGLQGAAIGGVLAAIYGCCILTRKQGI